MTSVIHRPRQSPWTAVSMDEALELVRLNSPQSKIVDVKLKDLKTGDIIACDIHSKWPHPRYRTSRMDGYAFKASDGTGQFQVLGGIEAGSSACALPIPSRHCYRINTGGVVPDEADTVVPVEYTRLIEHDDKNELVIEIDREMTTGQNIRLIGSDIPANAHLIAKNTELKAAELALIASIAPDAKLQIYAQPTIGVLSTGDELVDPLSDSNGSELKEGQIYDSNRLMLLEIFKTRNFKIWNGGIARDSREQLKYAILDCFQHCDILTVSGGVSMGDKDLLKSVLVDDLKFKIHFGRVFMKPGLPTTFSTGKLESGKEVVVFGLPGNPVSAFVSAHLFVFPLVKQEMGHDWSSAVGSFIKVKLNRKYSLDSRPEYVRACLQFSDSGLPIAQIVETNQVSSRLISVQHINLLLKMPPKSLEKTEINEDEIIDAIIIDRV